MTEFGLIEQIKTLFGTISSNGFEGIGDDCAIFSLGNGESLVFTTDMLVEDVHFLRAATSAEELGRKSLAVNLSDVAAMGAVPVATLLSVALPREMMGPWVADFMNGYHALSQQQGVALVGGDTTASTAGITISVTAIGRVKDKHLKRRCDAQVGDLLFVAGEVGESGAGLKEILAGHYDTPQAAVHRNPVPQIAEGIWLGGRSEVHAMMDISDGIASDVRHIMEQSHVGVEVDTEQIPTVVELETALCAGEDYKLLFTADAEDAASLCANFSGHFGRDLYPIGRITDSQRLVWLRDGQPIQAEWQGFRHY
ncbi:MAG: thiamine-phosphate kinase [Alistipes sp.]